MFSLKSIQQVDKVLVLNCKEDILLVFEHLGFLHCRYCVLSDELESTILVVQFAFPQEDLRESPTPQKFDDLKVAKFQTIVTYWLLEQGWSDSHFLHRSVHQGLESSFSLLIDELR